MALFFSLCWGGGKPLEADIVSDAFVDIDADVKVNSGADVKLNVDVDLDVDFGR